MSAHEPVRMAQATADFEKILKQKMGTSTSGSEARKIMAQVGKDYDKMFNVASMSKGKWDIADSISSKLGDFNISDKANDVINNTTNL